MMIEDMYITSKYVAQVYVYGNDFKGDLVAIVVPDKEVIMSWAKEKGKKESFQDLCKTKVCVCLWERGCLHSLSNCVMPC